MTMTTSREAAPQDDPALFDETQFADVTEPSDTPAWVTGPAIEYADAAQRLGDDPDALKLWSAMTPLLDGSARSAKFWDYVPVTPLLEVPNGALPADLQGTRHRLLVLDDGAMPTGAFKVHGGVSDLLAALEQGKNLREIVGASTGNHAAALALASTILGLEATIYMPADTVQAKVDNTEQYGGKVVFRQSLEHALAAAQEHGQQPGAYFVHPYDMRNVVAGQGMSSVFLPGQLRAFGIDPATADVHRYEPMGGGGVAAGNGVSGKVMLPDSKLHVVQAQGAHAGVAMLRGERFDASRFDTAVDGAAVLNPGMLGMLALAAPGMVDRTHVASPAQAAEAMLTGVRVQTAESVERGSVRTRSISGMPEPAGALALAAALEDMRADRGGESVRVVHVTGINTTPAKVHEFATYANQLWHETGGRAGLSDSDAFELVSQGHLARRRAPTDLEEAAMAMAAAKRVVPRRPDLRVLSGR